jgi:hypothetical protein
MGVEDVTDTELGCTGDEAVYDSSCAAGMVGELSGVFQQNVYELDCATSAPTPLGAEASPPCRPRPSRWAP